MGDNDGIIASTSKSKDISEKNPQKRRLALVSVVSARSRASQLQFRDEFYDSDGLLFCKYCSHSIDFARIDTVEDHQRSKKHIAHKEKFEQDKLKSVSSGQKSSASATNEPAKQYTLAAAFSNSISRDARAEFVLDFISMCAQADIPLNKVPKMKPFF